VARILIAGCGYVGTALACSLIGDGHEVWTLTRSESPVVTGASGLRADLLDIAQLSVIPGELDFVFYTAASSGSLELNYRQTYLLGLENLIKTLIPSSATLSRFFFTSSTSVYGQSQGEWVDETSATLPVDFRGRIMLEAESLLLSAPFPATAVRFSGIYGPGRERMIRLAKESKESADSGRFTNRIHRTDCAGVLRYLTTLPQPESRYLASDNEPTSEQLILNWIRQQLALSPQELLVDLDLEGDSSASGRRCGNRKLLNAGYRFNYPTFREGYAPLLAVTAQS